MWLLAVIEPLDCKASSNSPRHRSSVSACCVQCKNGPGGKCIAQAWMQVLLLLLLLQRTHVQSCHADAGAELGDAGPGHEIGLEPISCGLSPIIRRPAMIQAAEVQVIRPPACVLCISLQSCPGPVLRVGEVQPCAWPLASGPSAPPLDIQIYNSSVFGNARRSPSTCQTFANAPMALLIREGSSRVLNMRFMRETPADKAWRLPL